MCIAYLPVYSFSVCSSSLVAAAVPHAVLPPCNAWGLGGVTNQYAFGGSLTGFIGVPEAIQLVAVPSMVPVSDNFASDTNSYNSDVPDPSGRFVSTVGAGTPGTFIGAPSIGRLWQFSALAQLRLYRTQTFRFAFPWPA